MTNMLDQYVSRFQNLPPFNVHAIIKSGMDTEPWYEVKASDVLRELVLDHLNVATQVSVVTAQIQKWGRLESLARRVWQVAERKYRAWRSRFYLESLEKVDKGDKKPTQAVIEARYRSHPEYQKLQAEIERAEEAYNSAHALLDAFKAQKAMLQNYAYRPRDGGAPQLSV